MRVSHEAPIAHMREVRKYIDYCYLLPHMLDQSKEYRDYFFESKEMGRHIIMDNSLHELGHPYSEPRLLFWLNKIQPQEFIVPDYWMDKDQTLAKAEEWINRKDIPKKTKTKLIAVVQAKTATEAVTCYTSLRKMGYEKIAFSYGADWYYREGLSTTPDSENKFITKGYGRYHFIKWMYNKGWIFDNHDIHLLGCNVPQEFSLYKGMPFISTIDTSNPVIHGLAGIKYEDYGLNDKIPDKVDTYVGDGDNWDIVLYNIEKFKSFIK